MEENNVVMAEWFDEHWYKIKKEKEDHYIASVTTKLDIERKYALEKWRGDVGNREADLISHDASNRGKRIHRALQIYLLGGAVIYNPVNNPIYREEDIQAIQAKSNGMIAILRDQGEMNDVWKLQKFFDILKPNVLFSEKIVFDIGLDIAGTADVVFKLKAGMYPVNSQPLEIPQAGLYIADLKTGKVVDDSAWCQMAAYTAAYEAMKLGTIEGCLILHTGSTNKAKNGIPGFNAKIMMKGELKSYLEDYFHLAAVWKRRNPNAGPMIFQFPTLIQRSTK